MKKSGPPASHAAGSFNPFSNPSVALVRLRGTEVGAAVILKPGASATPDELREFVKQQVAAFKYPRKVWIVDELPIGPTGKILKREIERPTL